MFVKIPDILPKCLPVMEEAGKLVRASWNQPHKIRHKGPIDLVTETDAAVEAFLRQHLAAILPDAFFLGEESAVNLQEWQAEPLCWVVDPVDGTTNYAHRIPIVGISVALCSFGEPMLGLVNAPMLGEMFYAGKGLGAFLNGEKVQVSAVEELSGALVATGFPYEFGDNLGMILGRLERVLPATQGLRRPGAASLDLAWVACGRLDAFYEDGLKPWDMAAGWVLVREAGGEVSSFTGAPASWGASLLATNAHLHQKMVKLITC